VSAAAASTPVCLDASFLLQLVLHGELVTPAADLWRAWHTEEQDLVAPSLIYYEVSNVLYRYVQAEWISMQDARRVFNRISDFSIVVYQDSALHRQALEVAERFSLPAAYDAHYLALAQRLGAEFWTADRKLVAAVRGSLPWVHLLTG
jgi:predicted nucleic acid-binding protein